MSHDRFTFTSDNLPRLKAKQLQKAFPFLKLSAAQEATARALGYASWYQCTQRGILGAGSLSDQEAGLEVRRSRYHHQARVLMAIGITPGDADRWVRAWGLTGQPSLAPDAGLSLYYLWDEALKRFEAGTIDDVQLAIVVGVDEYAEGHEILLPERICPGVILGPLEGDPYYVVDPKVAMSIPAYLRGLMSMYHCIDGAWLLKLYAPGFRDPFQLRSEPQAMSPIQHEWHFGTKCPHLREECVPALVKKALDRPEDFVILTIRQAPTAKRDFYDFAALDPGRHVAACLSGRDFAAFLRSKGSLDNLEVTWFMDVKFRPEIEWWQFLCGEDHIADMDDIELPFLSPGNGQRCAPIYSYPFKRAPMDSLEYDSMEIQFLIPLNHDYPEDDDDDWS